MSVSVTKLWPSSCSWCLSVQIVLDDAVVHHHDVAVAIAMRMRVLFGGPAVRRPARVADAVGAVDRVQPDGVFQVAQLARGAPHRQVMVAVQDRDAGRIVAAIFQAPQAVQNDRDRLPVPDVADNSTHNFRIAWERRQEGALPSARIIFAAKNTSPATKPSKAWYSRLRT